MRERDTRILHDLARFRCLSRDDLIELHFSELVKKVSRANEVLRRLVDRELIKVDRTHSPYLYFPAEFNVNTASQKIEHFRGIFKVYKDLRKNGLLERFDVEPKLGPKGTVEPDIFAIWKRAPFFIEVQQSNYINSVITKKLARYERYRYSREWEKLDWQRPGKKYFPNIWIIGERRIEGAGVLQTRNVADILKGDGHK
jgi:rhamnose utilization protein RhaD (predicted bifunctional aldolase and dehydrogenase)